MNKAKKIFDMRIELLSDMCCGTGEGNGSNIDICATFDEVGLPIIPAKRLKGILRECGQFLIEHNFVEKDTFDKVFGNINGKDGAIRIDNAYIEDYKNIKSDMSSIFKSKDVLSEIVTKQSVEDSFTTTRAQTSINENGTAKKNSLRTTQVIKKGSATFMFEITLDNPSDDDVKLLENCVKTLRHIGLNKSRGFGEVRCSIVALKDEMTDKDNENKIELPTEFTANKDSSKVTYDYKITLLDDVVMSAGSNVTNDYIPGSMLMGAFAKYTKDYDWFSNVVLKNTIFSNAYIADKTYEYTPNPLSLFGIKNKDDEVFNYADGYERDDDKQYVPFGGYSYIDKHKQEIITNSVKKAIEYHHTNGDKTNNIESMLFTYAKVLKGQTFKGTITASENIINLLRNVLTKHDNILFLGGSAAAQYAKCKAEISESKETAVETVIDKEKMIIEFLSDVIVYDKYGGNSGNIEHLIELIKSKVIRFDSVKSYTKTITVGGFNAKWKLPKRQYTAFVKGSVLELAGCMSIKDEQKINSTGFIGVLCNEGYGQYRIRTTQSNTFKMVKPDPIKTENYNANDNTVKIIKDIQLNYLKNFYKQKAMINANAISPNQLVPSNSCAMRLLSAYQSVAAKEDIQVELQEFIGKNFTVNEDLKDFSNKAINSFDAVNLPQIIYIDKVKDGNKNQLFKEYIKSYLSQIKRRYQRNEDKNKTPKKLKR